MKSRKLWFYIVVILSMIMVACNPKAITAPVKVPSPTIMGNTPTPTVNPTATTSPTPAFIYEFTEEQCPLLLPDGAVEGENVICGIVTVPELHDQPQGKLIDLKVAIVKSVNQPSRPDPLFMLAGGPGSSAINTFIPILFLPFGERFRTDRDVIIVEQRGTLYSTPYLHCDEIETMNLELMGQNLSLEERKPILEDNLNACYQRLSNADINLSAYNSLENAADIAVVANTLGYDSYNIYGGSYGTMLAQHLMRFYPQTIRSVILDSVAPLRHDPNVLHKAASFERALKLLFAQCAADTACATAYPDLERLFFETIMTLNAKPVTIMVTDAALGRDYALLLTGDKLAQIVRDYLYHTPLLPAIPQLLTDIATGNYTTLSALQSALIFNQDFADGMYKSVVCSELVDFTLEDFSDPTVLYPDISRVMDNMLSELWVDACQIWSVSKLDESMKTSVVSDIPTLLLSGEFDPTTPPSLAYVASERMSHAYPITFPGIAHGVLGSSECATTLMIEFLDDPEIKPDTSCLQVSGSIKFSVPENHTAEVTLSPFTIESKGIQGLSPEGWNEVQPGLFVRGKSALDQILIIFDAVADQDPSVFIPGLLSFLNLEEFPGESTSTLMIHDIQWNLYRLETTVNGITVHSSIGLAQQGSDAYVIVLMTTPEESDWLYESVFLPVVEALVPIE